jgi:hypothetical protein
MAEENAATSLRNPSRENPMPTAKSILAALKKKGKPIY